MKKSKNSFDVYNSDIKKGHRIWCSFFIRRKLRSYEIKTLRENHTAAERKMPLVRPAAGGESCKAGFFLVS